MKNNKHKFAFTLAEVLVTLGIIGVVAVLTVPNVISNYQKKVYVVQLQKAYNQLQQVFSLAMAEDEVEYLADTELFISWGTSSNPEQNFVTQLSKYLKFSRTCFANYDSDESLSGCERINYSYLNGGGQYFHSEERFNVSLNDGSIYYLYLFPTIFYSEEECDGIREDGGGLFSVSGDIYIDVNGKKGPNRLGRDLFVFIVDGKGQLYSSGSVSTNGKSMSWQNPRYDSEQCDASVNGAGEYCAGRIFDEGWQMNY